MHVLETHTEGSASEEVCGPPNQFHMCQMDVDDMQ